MIVWMLWNRRWKCHRTSKTRIKTIVLKWFWAVFSKYWIRFPIWMSTFSGNLNSIFINFFFNFSTKDNSHLHIRQALFQSIFVDQNGLCAIKERNRLHRRQHKHTQTNNQNKNPRTIKTRVNAERKCMRSHQNKNSTIRPSSPYRRSDYDEW